MITLQDITVRRGSKVVLGGASLTLHPGEAVGLIGHNGAGKSTLFGVLAGRLQLDKGDAHIPSAWRMAEVAQQMPDSEDGATEFVLQGDAPLQAAYAALADAEALGDGEAMAHAHLALEEAGAFDATSRAQALLLGLGFKVSQLDAPVNTFSGGWRMRLQLARALMCPSDWMLLDEPTNHLDLDALVWLEGWLKRYPGLLIIISHDREFLDALCGVIVHLHEGQLTRYSGNYSSFETQRAERMTLQAAAYGKQQERIAHLQRFIDRFKAKASKAKQAQSRVKALARMEKLAPVLTASDFAFEFAEPASLPSPMLAMRDVQCGYRVPPAGGYASAPTEGAAGRALGRPGAAAGVVPPAGGNNDAGLNHPSVASTIIVRDVNATVLAGQRIGILGANGQGKSTLVKTIARTLAPVSGTLTEGKGLAIGYFAQAEMDVLAEDDTPLAHLTRLARAAVDAGARSASEATEQALRNFLGQFRFAGEMVHQPIATLSGGEQARLVLAQLVWQRPNLLLLDEPTNHLDLTTREALSMALNEFEGTVMLVSHDRALLREVCDEFWLVADGALQPFDGDLDDYQRWLLERSREAQRAASGKPPPPPKPTAVAAPVAASPSAKAGPPAKPQAPGDARKAAAAQRQQRASQTRPLRTELAQVDARMAKLNQERAQLEAQIVDGALSGSAMADAGRTLNHIAAEVALLEERWLELSTQIEAIDQAP